MSLTNIRQFSVQQPSSNSYSLKQGNGFGLALAGALLGIALGAPLIACADFYDPMIPSDELALMVRPLSQEELFNKADAMQKAIEAKAKEIAEIDLRVLRTKKLAEAEEAARLATAEAEAAKRPEAAKQKIEDSVEAEVEEAADEVDEKKVQLLERESKLREERTLLIDNMKVILDELLRKTDNNDEESQSRIFNHRIYISAVSGIHVDVSDTTSAWINIRTWVTSKQGGIRWAINFAKFLGFLVFVWLLSRFSGFLAKQATQRSSLSALQSEFLSATIRFLTLMFGLIWSLTALQVSMAPILTMVGAAGLVIALAMQDSLSNVANGLMILLFRPFDIGDIVEAGGVSGRIVSMNLVSTTIKTFDNKMMVVPNSRIWSDVITNATDIQTRRVDMEFGIGYDDDLDQAESILREIVSSHPKVMKDPAPTIKLMTLGDSSVNFICRPWCTPDDYWDVYWDVTRQVKIRFDEANIGIPFPQQDVNLYVKEISPKPKKPQQDQDLNPEEHPNESPHDDAGLDDGDMEKDGSEK